MKELSLQHRVAIITGGNKGIGREIALAYAREGCTVVLAARGAEALRQTADVIEKNTSKPVPFFPLDVTDETAVKAMIEDVLKKFQRIDILVNAAAMIGPIGPLETMNAAEWEKTISVNLLGTYIASQAVIPTMIEQRHGTIINFAGGGAFGARPRFSAYSVSKAAVVRLTDAMAQELGDKGIIVNGISPGQVNTEMFEAMVAAGKERVGDKAWQEFEQRKKTGGDRIEDVAALALFLISEEGRRISGRVISVQWDPWKTFPEHADEIMASDIYTMRRIKPEDYDKHW